MFTFPFFPAFSSPLGCWFLLRSVSTLRSEWRASDQWELNEAMMWVFFPSAEAESYKPETCFVRWKKAKQAPDIRTIMLFSSLWPFYSSERSEMNDWSKLAFCVRSLAELYQNAWKQSRSRIYLNENRSYKKEKDSCCCLLWSDALPLQQEVKHLPLWCPHGSTGGAARDIWRVWPVPGRFKDAGVVWRRHRDRLLTAWSGWLSCTERACEHHNKRSKKRKKILFKYILCSRGQQRMVSNECFLCFPWFLSLQVF